MKKIILLLLISIAFVSCGKSLRSRPSRTRVRTNVGLENGDFKALKKSIYANVDLQTLVTPKDGETLEYSLSFNSLRIKSFKTNNEQGLDCKYEYKKVKVIEVIKKDSKGLYHSEMSTTPIEVSYVGAPVESTKIACDSIVISKLTKVEDRIINLSQSNQNFKDSLSNELLKIDSICSKREVLTSGKCLGLRIRSFNISNNYPRERDATYDIKLEVRTDNGTQDIRYWFSLNFSYFNHGGILHKSAPLLLKSGSSSEFITNFELLNYSI